ncbi:MAG: twin-arginine translocation signal domain-containing protein [Candidatus Methylomirabilis oxyfera]|nr:twin-arginine translocation signal domain-containing protein [Candidatus Methylomirabilis oxyfera]
MCICMTRREFLQAASIVAGGLALSGALPNAVAGAQSSAPVPTLLDGTQAILAPLITRYAPLQDDPWVMMHGVRAMGPGFTVGSERAVDLLCSRFLKHKQVAGKAYLYMPVEHEGHANACLKTLLEVGVQPSHSFTLDGRRYTVGDLVNSAKALFVFDPKTIDRDELAWTLIAFSLQLQPSGDTWTNAYGQQIRFADVVRFGLDTLDETTRQFRQAKARGVMPTEKDAIMGLTCGGTHLAYSLASCVANGHGGEEARARLQGYLDLHIWRLQADGYLMDRFYRQAAPSQSAPPALQRLAALYYHDATLKFYGHSFEIIGFAKRHRLLAPTPAHTRAIEQGATTLHEAAKAMEGIDFFEFRQTNLRLFHHLVGDSCHAYHGIRMTPGVHQI